MDGQQWLLAPLTDKDISELDHWLQARTLRIARASLEPGMSDAERREMLDIALDRASRASFLSHHGTEVWFTLEGLTQIYWHMLKHNHPSLSIENLGRMLRDSRNLDEANDGLAILDAPKKNDEPMPLKAPKPPRIRPKRKNRRSP
jgi:hypothetical protein